MIGPEFGVRVSDGTVVVTTKVVEAISPVLPFTLTVNGPGVAVVATLKLLAVNAPVAVIVHATDAKITGVAGDCRKLHAPTSPVLKPLPLTAMLVPMGPETGLTLMLGPVTTKLAEAVSPVLPFTETTYVPGVIGDATVKLVADNVPVESIEHATAVKRTGADGDCRKLHRPESAVLKP